MVQRPSSTKSITPNGHSSKSQSDVKGVSFLLLSIQASLQQLGADKLCSTIMEECVASFQKRHNLTDGDLPERIVWKESSLEALLRLLDYLRAEVKEQLNDQACAQQLSLCVDQLTKSHQLSP